jgi:hypothetical protein
VREESQQSLIEDHKRQKTQESGQVPSYNTASRVPLSLQLSGSIMLCCLHLCTFNRDAMEWHHLHASFVALLGFDFMGRLQGLVAARSVVRSHDTHACR